MFLTGLLIAMLVSVGLIGYLILLPRSADRVAKQVPTYVFAAILAVSLAQFL